MPRPFSLSRLLPAALLLVAAPGWGAEAPAQELTAQRQTITDLRAVGTAMFEWFAHEQFPKAAKLGGPSMMTPSEGDPIDFAAVPVISRAELAKVLVPKYIPAIPEKDGWGRPYEFRLETRNPNAAHIMAIRSRGRDGQAPGTVYTIGTFSRGEEDQDLLWMDGYFVRWPQRRAEPATH